MTGDKEHWAVGLSDDEARELSILLDELQAALDRHEEAGEWRDELWERRRVDRPSGPTGDRDE